MEPEGSLRVHNIPPLAPILIQMHPVHTFPPCFSPPIYAQVFQVVSATKISYAFLVSVMPITCPCQSRFHWFVLPNMFFLTRNHFLPLSVSGRSVKSQLSFLLLMLQLDECSAYHWGMNLITW